MTPYTPPPMPVMPVLDDAIDAILFGTGGLLAVPPGGYLGVQWLTRKGCYRLTVDLVIQPVERRERAKGIGARRLLELESRAG